MTFSKQQRGLKLSRYHYHIPRFCSAVTPAQSSSRITITAGFGRQDGKCRMACPKKKLAQQRSNSVTKQSHTPPPPVKEHALVSQHPDATHTVPGHGMHSKTHTWSELEGSKNGNCRREWRIKNDLIAFPSSATCSASPWFSRNLPQKKSDTHQKENSRLLRIFGGKNTRK